MNQRRVAFLLVLASIGVYGGLLMRGDLEFVYDDTQFVRDNPAIRSLDNPARFFTDPATADTRSWSGIYRPLRTLDFAVDYAVLGSTDFVGAVRWYHLRNVLYHSIGTLLVLALLLQWGADRRWASLGALLFALHPVQTESVAWITSRADVMSLVFVLAGLLLHARSRGWDRNRAGAILLLLLALFSKEAAIVFGVAAILTDFLFRDGRKLKTTLARWPIYLIYLVITGVYIWIWINRHQVHEGEYWKMGPLLEGLIPGQLFTMARGFIYYVRLILLPVDLAQDFYVREIGELDLLTVGCGILILLAIGYSVLKLLRTGGPFAFCVVWFFITMFPTSNLVIPIGIPTAERFLYLPMVGVAYWGGSVLARLSRTGLRGQISIAVLFCCLFVLTFTRAQVWATADTLWASTSRYMSPRATEWFAFAERVKGVELQDAERELRDKGMVDKANRLRIESIEHLNKSLELYNRAIDGWEIITPREQPIIKAIAQQAVTLFDLKRFDDALERSDFCLQRWPGLDMARYSRSLALLGLGRIRAAAAEIEAALAIYGKQSYRDAGGGIYEKLGEFYEDRGNRAQAYLALKRSIELMPSEEDNPVAHAAVRDMDAEYQQLVTTLERAIEENPEDGDSRISLACAHAAFGNYRIAGPMFDDLLREDQVGRVPLILGPYALYFWQWRDTKEGYERAIAIYREMLTVEPGRSDVLELIATCEREMKILSEEAK